MSRPAAALIVALVVVVVGLLGVVGFFTWRSIDEGQRIGRWSYSQLLNEAQSGQVVTVVIDGQTGLATDRSGRQYFVTLPADTTATAKTLTGYGVKVTFRQQRDAPYWLQVLIPNLFLLVLVIGGIFGLVLLVRRSGRGS